MNYSSWLTAACYAGAVALVGSIPIILSDGSITGQEWWLLGTGFFSNVLAWMKTHPPVDKDGDLYGSDKYDVKG